jgi:malonyl-CoA decarboxylase
MSASSTFFDRTLSNIRTVWRGIASLRKDSDTLRFSEDLPDSEHSLLLEKIDECLKGKGGEVSARIRAAALGEMYLGLNGQGKVRFLQILAHNFGVDHDEIKALSDGLCEDCSDAERIALEQSLRRQLSPPYLTLLTQFNALPQGVKFLVDMRTDLLRCKRGDAQMGMMDEVLRERLSIWFDIGFLELRRITWDAPASLLEKLVHYEAVHKIGSWKDLKNRLEDDRRCFAYFHPRMPDEPLIFVWVALVPSISDNIADLLDINSIRCDPNQVSTAIFYSISNTQSGLDRVSLGNFLIKRVVDQLLSELPHLKTFSTLSPVPGFAKWLREKLELDGRQCLLDAERNALQSYADGDDGTDLLTLLESAKWHKDKLLCDVLQAPVKRLCARYLVNEIYRNRALDPVANFHLANGALIERINWLGDMSRKGLGESYGLMVNYLYNLDEIEKNHENYRESKQIAASKPVRALVDKR